jgi:hypothetical protein
VVVGESIPDLEPILTVQDASWQDGGVTCRILNFGLGRVDSCEIAFNILPRDAEPKFDDYEFLEKLEGFGESHILAAAGNASGRGGRRRDCGSRTPDVR